MDSLLRSLIGWHFWRTPAPFRSRLRQSDQSEFDELWERLSEADRAMLNQLRNRLAEAGVGALLFGETGYPQALAGMKSPPPVIYVAGNVRLLDRPAIGVCGSRSASEAGLNAAGGLARSVVRDGDVVVAGNALGVDAEAQGSALSAGGEVIAVLPEGITHFRLRTGGHGTEFDEDQLLVISQFPPLQPWSVGNAMARNAVIAGISRALVVIEAGERGGTLAAGEAGLKMGRRVVALEFGGGTPAGNAILIEQGALRARTPRELNARLGEALSQPIGQSPEQVSLSL